MLKVIYRGKFHVFYFLLLTPNCTHSLNGIAFMHNIVPPVVKSHSNLHVCYATVTEYILALKTFTYLTVMFKILYIL